MKYVLAILLLLSALPTAQAAGCPMEHEQNGATHQHELHKGNGASDSKHDCCDTDGDEVDHDCTQSAHCAPCLSIAPGINSNSSAGLQAVVRRFDAEGGDGYNAPPLHPPFRPPIS